MPIPEVLEAPSMVIGAAGSGAITDWSPTSWKPPNEVSAAGRHVEADGPVLVEMATLAGTTMGSVSPVEDGGLTGLTDDDDLRSSRADGAGHRPARG